MTPYNKEFLLDDIFNLILNGFNKKVIQKKLTLSKQNLNYYLRRLENLNAIKRDGKYLIKVINKSFTSKNIYPRVTINQVKIGLNKRGHAFNFKIVFQKEVNLLEKPKVKHELALKNLEKLPFGSLKLIKDKNSIWINKKSLTIYSNNSYYSNNALHSKFRVLKEIDKLVVYLKDRFGFSGAYGIEIFREHYGLIFNKFAQWILKNGRKLYVKDKGNKTTLWVDNSREDDIGLKEFEGSDPIEINSAENYFVSHEKTNWKVTPEFILDGFGKTNQMIMQNASNLNYHAENMKSHVVAVQKLGNAVEELVDQVKKLKKPK